MTRGVILGGAGFIGGNIVNKIPLIEWIVFDDLSLGKFTELSGFKIYGDISDQDAVNKAVDHAVDFVIMVNGLSSNPMYYPDPRRGFETMLMGALNVFEACRKHDVKHVYYASTSSLYGNTIKDRQVEHGIVTPPNFYSCAKRAVEDVARVYFNEYGINSIGFRYFSVYGQRERHKGQYANIITQFIWDMLKGKRPVIYGNGKQTRDFTHVNDVVRANQLAIEQAPKGAHVLNIGTGTSTSFNEVVEIINRHLDTNIEPEYKRNPIDCYVQDTLANTEAAKKLLGFRARISLDEGIKDTIDHYQQFCEDEK